MEKKINSWMVFWCVLFLVGWHAPAKAAPPEGEAAAATSNEATPANEQAGAPERPMASDDGDADADADTDANAEDDGDEAAEAAALEEARKWWEWQRSFPASEPPPTAGIDARRQKAALLLRQSQAASRLKASGLRTANAAVTFSGTWSAEGPTGLEGGRAHQVVMDPANANVLYLATDGGGIWKSTDAGTTWTPIGDALPSLTIGTVAVDPNDSRKLYAGTGGGWSNGKTSNAAGVLKSIDGGQTWQAIAGPFLPPAVNFAGWVTSLSVDPGNSNVIVATGRYGFYRSSDAGLTWSTTLAATAQGGALVRSPSNPQLLYATMITKSAGYGYGQGGPFGAITTGSGGIGVYKSTDGGQSWALLPPPAAVPANFTNAIVAIDPAQPAVVYSVLMAFPGNIPYLFRSDDSGANWVSVATLSAQTTNPFASALAVDPVDSNTLLYGGVAAFRSTDHGATWSALAFQHADINDIRFTADGTQAWIASDGGVALLSNPKTATAMTNKSQTLGTITFYPGLATDPNNADRVFGGTQDTGGYRRNGPSSWTKVSACGDMGRFVIDPSTSNNVYGINTAGGFCAGGALILRSTDGGATFNAAVSGMTDGVNATFDPPLVLDPSHPATLYYGSNRVFRSTDAAQTWQAVSADLTQGTRPFQTGAGYHLGALAVAPGNSDIVYTGAEDGVISRTTNMSAGASATWTNVTTNQLPIRFITHLEVDPTNSSVVYAAFSAYNAVGVVPGHVFQSTDAGQNWADISGDLPDTPVLDLVVDPAVANTIYVATDASAYWTSNGGKNWQVLGQGLPNAVVSSINFHAASRLLRVSTYGRGTWSMAAPAAASLSLMTSPASLAFGSQALETTSGGRSVTITNNSRTQAMALTVTVDTGFTQTNNCGASLPPAQSCTVTVAFAPVVGGGATGNLTVSGGGATQAIALSGTGTVSATLSASSTALTTGSNTTLTWKGPAVSTCTGSGGVAGDGWNGARAASGTLAVTEATAGTYTYVISCSSGGQSGQAQVAVVFSAPASGGTGGGTGGGGTGGGSGSSGGGGGALGGGWLVALALLAARRASAGRRERVQ
jgi:photosystem II stability/assembly factor-like uncharacterized protein